LLVAGVTAFACIPAVAGVLQNTQILKKLPFYGCLKILNV
jgi:hypothetical protein